MRDHWRAEDDYKVSSRGRDQRARDLHPDSPAAPQRKKDPELELKIKGRANAESNRLSPRRTGKHQEEISSRKGIVRDTSRSPRRKKDKGEERVKRPRDLSQDRHFVRAQRQEESHPAKRRRRTRSRSPARETVEFRDREGRRRSRSPIHLSRGDNFRPRSRHRERVLSPPRLSRGDYYSSYPDPHTSPSRFGDSYVPGGRRRRSPSVEHHLDRRRSRSRTRYIRPRTPVSHRVSTPDRVPTDRRATKSSHYHRSPKPSHSNHPETSHRHRRSTPLEPHEVSRECPRKDRHPHSPVHQDNKRPSKKMQQSPTRPIQSILDTHPRAPSPPRRIPSFESHNQTSSVNLNNAFPMHGTKTVNAHNAHRPNRPPHLNTQNSYGTSPHWTPNSSHHGSPHSGSPFNQSRGGWNAQPHQYQNQPK